MTARATDGTELYFETHGSPSNPAIFMGPHFYATRSDPDESFTKQWIDGLVQDFYLIIADYPRGMGRTLKPQGLGFTAEIAATEYQLIADAARIQRFAWLGYSFGAAMGVQVACRTERVTALAVGGFPPLNAPFGRLADISRQQHTAPPPLDDHTDPGILASAMGFYESLEHWPERAEVTKLKMPRLVFMGELDGMEESASIPLGPALHAVQEDLEALGWNVAWLKGEDHRTAIDPAVALPMVHRFLIDAVKRT